MKFARCTFCTALLVATVGCSGPKFVGRPGLSTVSAASAQVLPVPAQGEYLIGYNDKLRVDVFGVFDPSPEVIVDPGGEIDIPLAGRLQVLGKTPSGLSSEIRARLRDAAVRDPHVSVNVLEVLSQAVTVEGAVKQPGIYPISGKMTLLRAIARAQGTTEYTREDFVVVYRTVGDQKYAGLYDLRAIRTGAYEDPVIVSDDVVVIGDSQARRIFNQAISASGILIAPVIALLK